MYKDMLPPVKNYHPRDPEKCKYKSQDITRTFNAVDAEFGKLDISILKIMYGLVFF